VVVDEDSGTKEEPYARLTLLSGLRNAVAPL